MRERRQSPSHQTIAVENILTVVDFLPVAAMVSRFCCASVSALLIPGNRSHISCRISSQVCRDLSFKSGCVVADSSNAKRLARRPGDSGGGEQGRRYPLWP
jgi:hypothetical protein